MIHQAELFQEAIDDWVFKTPGLRTLLLTEDDWKTLREIADILEPFTKVTLQMSQSKIPTIPFILPLYHKMEQHLVTVSASWDMSFKIQHAAKHGLEKLRKYTIPAKLHHSYIIRTILHPCLHSHWFAATADPSNLATQKEAISTAEAIFCYITETYLETSTPPAPVVAPKTATAMPTCSPQEELANELDWYLRFKAVPVEQKEGEDYQNLDELSAEEVLLNLLLWWKIHTTKFPTIAQMAHNYLAIPATSVSVECEKTIKMALLIKAWIQSGSFEMMPQKVQRWKHGDNSKKK
ncbi:hypothetical protein AX15_001739 [Amanita polypyramis BW_CC]|nr:hypothetical protein AX15_001739 [Amanita polypyramis BW_CC]